MATLFDRRNRRWFLVGGLMLLAGGCSSLRGQRVVSESIATSRQLSREGMAAMELGDLPRAQELLDNAVTTSPTDIDARRQLAEVLWQNGSTPEAVVHMEAAVQLDPRHAPTIVRAGEMLLASGATNRALQRAEQAIALDPTLAGAWALRGRVYRRQGRAEQALADLQQALRFAPHSTEALWEAAEAQYDLGRPQRSLTTLHHLLDVYPAGEVPQRVLWLEGTVYTAMGRHQDAAQSLCAASQRGEPRPELLYALAQAERAAGDPAAAAQTVRRALAVDQAHQPSQVLLAQLEGSLAPERGGVIRR